MALLDQIPMCLLKIVLSKGNEPTALKELIVIFEKVRLANTDNNTIQYLNYCAI